MSKRVKLIATTLLTVAALFAPTVANANSNHMLVGKFTSQPIGHYNYCKTNIIDCNLASHNTKPVKLTKSRWRQLVEVNAYANYTVQPVTDIEYYGVDELWVFPKKYGDCEDYVLLKRKILMDKGWPASSLLITVVRQKNGEGHAVLTARTSKGDFVLDNLSDKVKVWNRTGYRFLKRQASVHSGRWEDIIDR